jgi:acetolactate synthase-1/2/3 large subunit
MTGGKAVVQALIANGAEAVFGIPGVHNLFIYDALIDSGIKHYVTRHEQGAGFMADGYARATGKPGVCLPITGPGLTNASTPIAQAFSDSSPVLVVSSQIETDLCDRQKGTLHELKNQMAFMAQITEWNVRTKDQQDCVTQVNRAYTWLAKRRRRPVHIEVPLDVQNVEAEVDVKPATGDEFPALCPDPQDIERATDLLKKSRRPVIYAGGGALASGAGPEILELSARLGAPVITSCQGKGTVPEDHPAVLGNNLNEPQVKELLDTCDATIAVGTHFGASNTLSWRAKFPGPMIHIDMDRTEFGKNYTPAVTVWADAKPALAAILEALGPGSCCGCIDEVTGVKQALLTAANRAVPWEMSYAVVLRSALDRDGILVCDMAALTYPLTRLYPVYEPRTFMFPRGLGTLGFGPPAAMGAKIARPGKKVVTIAGDGGFLFTCEELATAAQYSIPVVIVILNSNSYETVRRNQASRFGKNREVDVYLRNPDFGKFADAFGVWYEKAGDVSSFEKALGRALEQKGPAIVETPFVRP